MKNSTNIHDRLQSNYKWYHSWHSAPHHRNVHWVILAVFSLSYLILIYNLFYRQAEASGNNALSNLTVTTYANSDTVSVYGNYSGDDNNNSSALLLYKETGAETWIRGMDLSRPTGLKQLAGFFFAKPGISYNIAVVFDDPDGKPEVFDLQTTSTTRVINPVSNGNRYYVSVESGSDENPGTESNPFKTIGKAALVVNAGDTVNIMNGTYRERIDFGNGTKTGADNNWITFKNYNDNKPVIDGSYDQESLVWEPYDLQNGIYSTTIAYTCRRQDGSASPFRTKLSIDGRRSFKFETINDLTSEQFNYRGGDYFLAGAGGWAHEPLDLKQNGDPVTIYVRTKDGLSPASHTINLTRQEGAGFALEALSHIYIRGLTFKYYETAVRLTANSNNIENIILENNEFIGNFASVSSEGDYPIRNITILNNRFLEQGVMDLVSDRETSWLAGKNNGFGASVSLKISNGGIVKNNYVEGSFDGIDVTSWPPLFSRPSHDTDIYENEIVDCSDDGIENEGSDQTNIRIWNNLIHSSWGAAEQRARVGISTVPVLRGPSYIIRNTLTDLWGTGIKLGSAKEEESEPNSEGVVIFYHNVVNTPESNTVHCTNPPLYSNHRFINNIFNASDFVLYHTTPCSPENSTYDFNQSFSSKTKIAANWNSETDYSDFTQFQSATGQETHGVYDEPVFEDIVNHNFKTTSGNKGVDKGLLIYGINDCNSPWPYQGEAPDIGLNEVQTGLSHCNSQASNVGDEDATIGLESTDNNIIIPEKYGIKSLSKVVLSKTESEKVANQEAVTEAQTENTENKELDTTETVTAEKVAAAPIKPSNKNYEIFIILVCLFGLTLVSGSLIAFKIFQNDRKIKVAKKFIQAKDFEIALIKLIEVLKNYPTETQRDTVTKLKIEIIDYKLEVLKNDKLEELRKHAIDIAKKLKLENEKDKRPFEEIFNGYSEKDLRLFINEWGN